MTFASGAKFAVLRVLWVMALALASPDHVEAALRS